MESKEPITDYSLLDQNASYTYSDYLRWHFKERVELIKGKIFKMSPAANTNHQKVSSNISRLFLDFFHKQVCQVYYAPFDVRLFSGEDEKVKTVVQPDLCVICDSHKIKKQGCLGAPDLIIEIISQSNSKHDLSTKFNLYQEAGVNEYWLVDPYNKSVLVYILDQGKYRGLKPFTEGETFQSVLFSELTIKVSEVFEGLIDFDS